MTIDERNFLDGSSVVENVAYLLPSLDVRSAGAYGPKCSSSQSQNCTNSGRLDKGLYGPKCSSSQSQNCTSSGRLENKIV